MSYYVVKTVKVQPWGKNQGDFVEINETDFDPKIHKLYEGKTPVAPPPPAGAVKKPVAPQINFASDEAAELAASVGLTPDELVNIKGTGENKAITAADIEKYLETKG